MNAGEIVLTAGQRRFAQAHMAVPGERAAGAPHLVFMYHRDEAGTHRWLVDEFGWVIERTWFSVYDAPPRGPGRFARGKVTST